MAGLGVLVIAFGDLIPQFSSRRIVVGLLGICGLLSGGLLLFSRRYVWRTRFYLFFAGIGLIVLVGGWAIPAELLESKAPASRSARFRKSSASILLPRFSSRIRA